MFWSTLRSFRAGMGSVWMCAMIVGMMGLWGCPSPSSNTEGTSNVDGGNQADGGTNPEQTVVTEESKLTECKAGTACIQVGSAEIRSCEFLLTSGQNVTDPQVTFDTEVIGQSKAKDKRLALAWLVQKDSAFAKDRYVVVIQLKDGVKDLKLETSACYDRKGAKLGNPDVKLVTP